MAHTSKLGALADGLVTSITGLDTQHNAEDFKRYKDLTLKGIRNQSFARVNQFDVKLRLDGLIEKFAILNQEPLSEALQSRLDELQTAKWTPEILALLLRLSDRPVERTRLEDLDGSHPASPPKELTWAEIIRDDPLSDDGIWDDVQYERDFSDEGSLFDEPLYEPTITAATSLDDEDYASRARSYLLPPDDEALRAVERTRLRQQSGSDSQLIRMTELQAIRETLQMLQGLPTMLYRFDPAAQITINQHCAVGTAAKSTMLGVLQHFQTIGSALHAIRRFINVSATSPSVETFQASVEKVIARFVHGMADIEQNFLRPSNDLVVSILVVLAEVRKFAGPTLVVARILNDNHALNSSPFAVLDTLYEHACALQLSSNDEVFEAVARLLFDGLSTHLRPWREWIDSGLSDSETEDFFVEVSKEADDLGSLWHAKYKLRTLSDGSPYAPTFLQPLVPMAFSEGKAVCFLRALGEDVDEIDQDSPKQFNSEFDLLLEQVKARPLLPFSELFEATLRSWAGQSSARLIRKTPATSLRMKLMDDCGMWQIIDAWELIFLSKDGTVFQMFADTVFERMRNGRYTWDDRFLLTELVQSTFGSAGCVHAECLTARLVRSHDRGLAPDAEALDGLLLDYVTPWSIQNVTRQSSPVTHQRAFSFILQAYRAKHSLRIQIFTIRCLSSSKRTQHAELLNLRTRLVWFVDVLLSHLTSAAALTTTALREGMASAEDLDSMAGMYSEYRTRLEARLLLGTNSKPIRDAVMGILRLCRAFELMWQYTVNDNVANTRPNIPRKYSRRPADDEDFSEEDFDADILSKQTDTKSTPHLALSTLQHEFDGLLSFIIAGLRGVSRAGGEMAWEMLAERLEWCKT